MACAGCAFASIALVTKSFTPSQPCQKKCATGSTLFKHQDGTTTTPVYEHDGWLLVAD
jgi:hypothetical protein